MKEYEELELDQQQPNLGQNTKEPSPSRVKLGMNTPVSNTFDVLNAVEDNCGSSDKETVQVDGNDQNPNVSEPIGNGISNVDVDKVQDEDRVFGRVLKLRRMLSLVSLWIKRMSQTRMKFSCRMIHTSPRLVEGSLWMKMTWIAMMDMRLKFMIYQRKCKPFVMSMISV
nr:hypothetical protein [Tanacetum cinerariifolium]